MNLYYAGSETMIELADTERNRKVGNTIDSGVYPGLVALDGVSGTITVNLSESVPFLIFDKD